MHTKRLVLFLLTLSMAAGAAPAAFAQSAANTSTTSASTAAQADDPDRDPNDNQPDFYVATLNTNLRLPSHKMAFRLTHRFLRTLGDGDFGDLAGRFFGLDSGAQIGLELKYALFSGAQIGVYRTSDKTIQFQGNYNILKDADHAFGLGAFVNVDGTDNFSDEFSPGFGVVISKELGGHGALYFQPSIVGNSRLNDLPSEADEDDFTALAGLGARLRFARNSYIFVEGSPRIAGYAPREGLISFGFEQRAGGHVFQLNFSNGFGTTLAQVARGGTARDDWYLGFNLSRKFY